MEGYIGFENYKDNKLRLEVGRVYTRRPVIGGKLSFFDNPLDVLRYYRHVIADTPELKARTIRQTSRGTM